MLKQTWHHKWSKISSSWQLFPLFGDQCLLHFFRDTCVVACCACCTRFKVLSQQYPTIVLENRYHYFGGWFMSLKLLWARRTTVPLILRFFFVSGSYKCIHVLSIVTSRAKKPTMFNVECSRIAFLWSHNTTLLIRIQTFWHPFGRKLSLVQHIMNPTCSWVCLQSLYYLSGWNSPICCNHAVNGIHIFRYSDHKWP